MPTITGQDVDRPTVARKSWNEDPTRAFRFELQIGDDTIGAHDVGPLASETDVTEYAEGTFAGRTIKVPGISRADDVVIERACRGNDEYFTAWRRKVIDYTTGGPVSPKSSIFRKDILVNLLDYSGTRIKTWKVYQAWPSRYECDNLNAESSDILNERITLANEGVEMIQKYTSGS